MLCRYVIHNTWYENVYMWNSQYLQWIRITIVPKTMLPKNNDSKNKNHLLHKQSTRATTMLVHKSFHYDWHAQLTTTLHRPKLLLKCPLRRPNKLTKNSNIHRTSQNLHSALPALHSTLSTRQVTVLSRVRALVFKLRICACSVVVPAVPVLFDPSLPNHLASHRQLSSDLPVWIRI